MEQDCPSFLGHYLSRLRAHSKIHPASDVVTEESERACPIARVGDGWRVCLLQFGVCDVHVSQCTETESSRSVSMDGMCSHIHIHAYIMKSVLPSV